MTLIYDFWCVKIIHFLKKITHRFSKLAHFSHFFNPDCHFGRSKLRTISKNWLISAILVHFSHFLPSANTVPNKKSGIFAWFIRADVQKLNTFSWHGICCTSGLPNSTAKMAGHFFPWPKTVTTKRVFFRLDNNKSHIIEKFGTVLKSLARYLLG